MPTYREDMHTGHKVPLVETDDIMKGAVTTDKLADNAVTESKLADNAVTERSVSSNTIATRHLQDRSVTEPKMADNSVSNRTVQDNAIDSRNLRRKAIKAHHIDDKQVLAKHIGDGQVKAIHIDKSQLDWDHLNPDLQNIIASREEGGVALSKEFGNSELIGITQKKLSEAHDDLQNQINAIVNDKAVISLKASPSVIFVNTQTPVTLTATTDTTASLIRIVTDADAAIIAEGSGSSLAKAVNLTMPSAGTAGYTAYFTISGIVKSTHVNISAVNKIYYGSGSAYTDATSSPSPKTSPAGTYNVTVAENGQYVFFVIPATMSINKATLSGFDFPLDAPVAETIDGVSYKVYRSSNTNDAGTYQIVVS